jgi:hypothetical protein
MGGIDPGEIGVGAERGGDGVRSLGLVGARIHVIEHLGVRLEHGIPEAIGATTDVGQAGLHVQDEVGTGTFGQLEHRCGGGFATEVVIRLDVLQLDWFAHRGVDGDYPLLGFHEALDVGDQRVRVGRRDDPALRTGGLRRVDQWPRLVDVPVVGAGPVQVDTELLGRGLGAAFDAGVERDADLAGHERHLDVLSGPGRWGCTPCARRDQRDD